MIAAPLMRNLRYTHKVVQATRAFATGRSARPLAIPQPTQSRSPLARGYDLDTRLAGGLAPAFAAFLEAGFVSLAKLIASETYTLPSLRNLGPVDPAVKERKYAQMWADTTQGTPPALPVSAAEFVLPQSHTLAGLALAIHSGGFPPSLAAKHRLSTAHDQLLHVLQHVYHRHLVPSRLALVAPRTLDIDILNPAEWFPEARKIKRRVIMHVGPTNSGKTYQALLRLERASTGYFAGPLRLLGREIYERMRAKGLRCNLITGEEIVPDLDKYGNPAGLSSGTVEMIDLTNEMEVCVLDEIQMIADRERGFAWTNAFLGVKAREIHLCGEASAVPLIQQLVAVTGDLLEINHYDRLGKLEMAKAAVRLGQLRPGDAVIAFSKRAILELRARIEKETQYKCAVVYGALPPETRNAQSDGFNSGKYDILVASDAVGMGLNLRIKRIVFSTISKFNGTEMEEVHPPQIKQIGGRAGRFKVALGARAERVEKSEPVERKATPGYISAFTAAQLQTISKGMDAPIKPLTHACLWPLDPIFARYISEFPSNSTFSQVLAAFQKDVHKSATYEISNLRPRMEIAAALDGVTRDHSLPLMVADVLKFATSPAKCSANQTSETELFQSFMRAVLTGSTTQVLDYPSLPFASLKVAQPSGEEAVLANLEFLHRSISLFLWFSYRYPTFFVDREGATDLKNLCEKRLMEELDCLKVTKRKDWQQHKAGARKNSFAGPSAFKGPKGHREPRAGTPPSKGPAGNGYFARKALSKTGRTPFGAF